MLISMFIQKKLQVFSYINLHCLVCWMSWVMKLHKILQESNLDLVLKNKINSMLQGSPFLNRHLKVSKLTHLRIVGPDSV